MCTSLIKSRGLITNHVYPPYVPGEDMRPSADEEWRRVQVGRPIFIYSYIITIHKEMTYLRS